MMTYTSTATIAMLRELDRIEVLGGERVVEVSLSNSLSISLMGGILGTHIGRSFLLPDVSDPEKSIKCYGGNGFLTLSYSGNDVDICIRNNADYKDIQIGRLDVEGKNPIVRLAPAMMANFKLWSEKYPSAPYKLLKERNGVVQDKHLFRYLHAILTAVREAAGEPLPRFAEDLLKEWTESRQPRRGYVYRINTAGLNRAQMEAVIAEVYAVHERTNTSSCMVKGDKDYEFGVGMDYYEGVLHPFHSYRAENWGLALVSEYAPDEVFAWQKETSPFRLRAWTYTNEVHEWDKGQIVETYIVSTYASCYGDTNYRCVLNEAVDHQTDLEGAEIRCYVENNCDEYTAPYVDGDCQHVYIDECVHAREDEDEMEYRLGAVRYHDYDTSGMFEVYHSDGQVKRCEYWYTCEVCGDDFTEDEMVWVSELDGYVHRDYWDFSRDCLDGLAVLRYFR